MHNSFSSLIILSTVKWSEKTVKMCRWHNTAGKNNITALCLPLVNCPLRFDDGKQCMTPFNLSHIRLFYFIFQFFGALLQTQPNTVYQRLTRYTLSILSCYLLNYPIRNYTAADILLQFLLFSSPRVTPHHHRFHLCLTPIALADQTSVDSILVNHHNPSTRNNIILSPPHLSSP